MKFHKQEHLVIQGSDKPKRGSCHPTVLACLMDLELNEVPYFHLFYLTPEEIKNLSDTYKEQFLENKPIEECEEYRQDNYHNAVQKAFSLWHDIHNIFIASRGYELNDISDIDNWLLENPDMPYLAYGFSSRGVGHVVIYKNGKLFHDPHPSNEGLTSLDAPEQFPFKVLRKRCQ